MSEIAIEKTRNFWRDATVALLIVYEIVKIPSWVVRTKQHYDGLSTGSEQKTLDQLDDKSA